MLAARVLAGLCLSHGRRGSGVCERDSERETTRRDLVTCKQKVMSQLSAKTAAKYEIEYLNPNQFRFLWNTSQGDSA